MGQGGTPILAGEREVGTLYTQSGGRGIAHLRFDWAVPGMTAADIGSRAETFAAAWRMLSTAAGADG